MTIDEYAGNGVASAEPLSDPFCEPMSALHNEFAWNLAHLRARSWRRVVRDTVPPPHSFSQVLWANVVVMYVVRSQMRPVGVVSIYDWNQLNGTAWAEAVSVYGEREADAVGQGFWGLIKQSWIDLRLRQVYVSVPEFERQPSPAPGWQVDAQGSFPDSVLWNGSYWSENLYRIKPVVEA
jgi:hypothetical protein